jgi:DNA-binding response OmpR family regulator
MSHVIVIENEGFVRRQLADMLRRYFDVMEASNAEDAKKLIDAHDVTVVILDLMLGVDSKSSYEFLKANCGPKAAREAIVITADMGENHVKKVLEHDVYCFFKKVVDPDELLVATRGAMTRVQAARGGAK